MFFHIKQKRVFYLKYFILNILNIGVLKIKLTNLFIKNLRSFFLKSYAITLSYKNTTCPVDENQTKFTDD